MAGIHTPDVTISDFVTRTEISYRKLLVSMADESNSLVKTRKRRKGQLDRFQGAEMITKMSKNYAASVYRHYLKYTIAFVEANGGTQFTELVAKLGLNWIEAEKVAAMFRRAGYSVVLDKDQFLAAATTAAPTATTVVTKGTSIAPVATTVVTKGTSIAPVATTVVTKGTSIAPVATTVVTKGTSIAPVATTVVTKGTSIAPVATTVVTKGTSIAPVATTVVTKGTSIAPVASTVVTKGTSIAPVASTVVTKGTSIAPVATTVVTKGTSIAPVASTVVTKGTSIAPVATTVVTKGTSIAPVATTVVTKGTSIAPVASTVVTKGTSIAPVATTVVTKGTSIAPVATTVVTKGTSIAPVATTVVTKGTSIAPVATTVVTKGTTIAPVATATQTDKEVDRLPLNWISTSKQIGHLKIELCPRSAEFKDVLRMIGSTKGRDVIQIHRIENPRLYKQYESQKSHIELTCPPGHKVEQILFHGTKASSLDSLLSGGFDRSLAGASVGSRYGAGSYFATRFSYSAKPAYAKEGHVLVCRVLTGQSVQGYKGQKVLPFKPAHPGIRYDSAVDSTERPTMYIIYADASVYSAYLVQVGPVQDDSL